ncbi:MAG: MCE family protein [Actinobacteria bacterium]|nr:MCE family protein [Actinomycetota bacterium]
MSKRAPSTTQLVVITAFALSCFGILLFLWVTFGGPTPFRAKPYQLKIPFNEATQLAEQSDVRISGVNIGKVQSIELAPNHKQALATVDIENQYAPLPEDTRAMLRTKTLLGETYVELTPGSSKSEKLADGATLPEANVTKSVQLDEIFRTFDPKTRAAFQAWMQEAAVAIDGQGQNLSYAIGEFEPTFTEFERLFRTLSSQELAVSQLFRNGATTFRALRGREGELANLIRNSNAVFTTTARRSRDIEALFRAFPTFLEESRLTLHDLRGFSENADPLVKQLVPAAEQLSPTLVSIAKLAPEAKEFFKALTKLNALAPTGFPALRKLFRDEFPPLLRALEPFLRNLNPILVGLGLYKNEVTSTFGNIAAVFHGELTEETASGKRQNYLRAMGPVNAETLSTYSNRLGISRSSAYSPPKWAELLKSGSLPVFNTSQCTTGSTATLDPGTAENPSFNERVVVLEGYPPRTEEATEKLTKQEQEVFYNSIKQYAFGGGTSTAGAPTPPCNQQAPFKPIYGTGPLTAYQHTFEQPSP